MRGGVRENICAWHCRTRELASLNAEATRRRMRRSYRSRARVDMWHDHGRVGPPINFQCIYAREM